jgi:hypothetical protein
MGILVSKGKLYKLKGEDGVEDRIAKVFKGVVTIVF